MRDEVYNQSDRLCQFKLKIRDAIRKDPQHNRTIQVARRACVYASGKQDTMVYYVECGQIKLVLYTPEGRECVLAIRTAGDIFGELCLTGQAIRAETAVAMQDTRLLAMSHLSLLRILREESLLESLVQYLAGCVAQQQETIGSLLTVNSEQRLARILLDLVRLLGRSDTHGVTTIPRILHEDLAAMVGTTRSRVGFFLKHFQECGLIEVKPDHSLRIEAERLQEFATNSAFIENAKTDAYENRWLRLTSSV